MTLTHHRSSIDEGDTGRIGVAATHPIDEGGSMFANVLQAFALCNREIDLNVSNVVGGCLGKRLKNLTRPRESHERNIVAQVRVKATKIREYHENP